MVVRRVWAALVALGVSLGLLAPVSVAASRDIAVEVDGIPLRVDVSPFEAGGRVYVPLRPIAEALGIEVYWYPEVRAAVFVGFGRKVTFWVGYGAYDVDGEVRGMDAPPRVVRGRMMVPVRYVARAFGATVEWDATLRRVVVFTGGKRGEARRQDAAGVPLVVVGKAGRRLGASELAFMKSVYSYLAGVFGITPDVVVFLYPSPQEYWKAFPRMAGRAYGHALCSLGAGEAHVADSGDEYFWRTYVHELVHTFACVKFGGCDELYSEGLAEVYSLGIVHGWDYVKEGLVRFIERGVSVDVIGRRRYYAEGPYEVLGSAIFVWADANRPDIMREIMEMYDRGERERVWEVFLRLAREMTPAQVEEALARFVSRGYKEFCASPGSG